MTKKLWCKNDSPCPWCDSDWENQPQIIILSIEEKESLKNTKDPELKMYYALIKITNDKSTAFLAWYNSILEGISFVTQIPRDMFIAGVPCELSDNELNAWVLEKFGKEEGEIILGIAYQSYWNKIGSEQPVQEYKTVKNTPISVKQIEEMLNTIPAGCDYKTWRDIAFALKHESLKTGIDLFFLFDQWSSSCPEKYNAKETLKQWTGIKPTPAGKKPITIATLHKAAQQNGWKPLSRIELYENRFNQVQEVKA